MDVLAEAVEQGKMNPKVFGLILVVGIVIWVLLHLGKRD